MIRNQLFAHAPGRQFWRAILIVAVLIKIILAAVTPLAGDFLGWISIGADVLSGSQYLGIYTGPAYIYAGALALWRLFAGNIDALNRLYYAYYSGPLIAGSQISPDVYLFTLTMKIPLLVTDVATMLLIMHIVMKCTGSESKSVIAGFMWAASPLVFMSEMFSTADIYSGSLILLGAYMIYESKPKFGSLSLAVGSILRFSPLLVTWIYPLAFARARNGKWFLSFIAVQLAIFGSLAIIIATLFGSTTLLELLTSSRPGILVPEALFAMGPFFLPTIPHNPYGLGLSLVGYFVIGYLITTPMIWKNRSVASEAVAVLAVFYAFTNFFPQFLMWFLPLLVTNAALSRSGVYRYLLVTVVGSLAILFRSSDYFAAYGRGVIFVPNWNSTMASVSATIYGLNTLTVVRSALDSAFTALMLVFIFWILVESRKSKLCATTTTRLADKTE